MTMDIIHKESGTLKRMPPYVCWIYSSSLKMIF